MQKVHIHVAVEEYWKLEMLIKFENASPEVQTIEA